MTVATIEPPFSTPRAHASRASSASSASQNATSAQSNSRAQGVQLSAQQESRVRDTVFASGNVPRVDRVDFSVNVGTAVPSHVHVVAVPDTLVQIYPQWRGNEYFVVRDEIVIVDHSRKIVAVIPGGSSHASKSRSRGTRP